LTREESSKGVIDEDPYSPETISIKKQLKNWKLVYNTNGIKVWYNKNRKNYLIMLCPRLEDWILRILREEKIDITEYGLPKDSEKLHEVINTKLISFEKLLQDISKSRTLKILQKFITQ
jgi:hypothetical protein